MKERLWSRNYVLAVAINFCLGCILYMLIATSALYAIEQFRSSEVEAGMVAGAFSIGAVVARPFAGKYIDFVGRRRLLVAALAVSVFASIVCVVVDELAVLVIVRVLHGVAQGVASTTVTTGALALIPASRRAEGTGYYGISSTLSSASGPFIGVLLMQSVGYDGVIFAATAFAAVGLAAAMIVRVPERMPTNEERGAKWSLRLSTLLDMRILPISVVMLVSAMAFTAILSFLNAYALVEGVSPPPSGVFFIVYAVSVLISRLFVGRLQDRFGDNAVVPALIASMSLGLLVLGVSPAGPYLVASATLVGLGFGGVLSGIQAITAEISASRLGLASSTYLLLADLGIGLGPIIGGAIAPLIGFRGMYLALGGAVLMCLLLYYFAHGRHQFPRATSQSDGSG